MVRVASDGRVLRTEGVLAGGALFDGLGGRKIDM